MEKSEAMIRHIPTATKLGPALSEQISCKGRHHLRIENEYSLGWWVNEEIERVKVKIEQMTAPSDIPQEACLQMVISPDIGLGASFFGPERCLRLTAVRPRGDLFSMLLCGVLRCPFAAPSCMKLSA